MTQHASLAITRADLEAVRDDAHALIERVKRVVPAAQRSQGTYLGGHSTTDEVGLIAIINGLCKNDPLMTEVQLHVIRTIRTGIELALHLTKQYRLRAGVATSDTTAHGLSDTQRTESNEKLQTAAAIGLFVFAQYIRFAMHSHVADNSFVGNVRVTVDQLDIIRPVVALQHAIFNLGKSIEADAGDADARLSAVVNAVAEEVEEQILNRLPGFRHTEPFTSVSYQLEGTDFTLTGFAPVEQGKTGSVEFNRVQMEQIVGNADAKHIARRLAFRLLCYNVSAGRNVFQELGGLAPVFMGFGKPGTGKSMLIAAIATLLEEYAGRIGMPFLFHPLPDTLIDPYQGKSAQNMVAWMRPFSSANRIVFGPIDDAENHFKARTGKTDNEGREGVIGVLLRHTEGAYAVNRGNSMIGLFTNLPDLIDPAVLSRIQGRMLIDGAATVEDFLDQTHLWQRKFVGQDGFINLADPANYQYLSAQAKLASLADATQTCDYPAHAGVAEIFTSVERECAPTEFRFFALLFRRFMERFPGFSSRDVRNIHSAVDQRIMDFDLPEAWFEHPETFSRLPYERQHEMVLDLRNQNLRGLSFAEVLRQEVVRYLDSYVRIANTAFDREVNELAHRMAVHAAAEAKFKKS
jgi:hypothetical protein